MLTGLLPAWQGTVGLNARVAPAGRRTTADRRRQRIRSGLVVTQVALGVVLVSGAALLVRSFGRLQSQDAGFRSESLLTLSISPSDRVPDDAIIPFYRALPGGLEAVPGVESASASSTLPISGGDSHGELTVEGTTFAPGTAPGASYRRILPNYFRTVGIPLRAGREFTPEDGTRDPAVTIVSETLARRHFGSAREAIGQRIKVGPPENEPWLTIVGVVGDVRNEGLEAPDTHATYEPHPQRPWRAMQVVVRATGDPAALVPSLRSALHEADPDIVVEDVTSMDQRIARSLAPRRFNMTVVSALGVLTLLLAAIGCTD